MNVTKRSFRETPNYLPNTNAAKSGSLRKENYFAIRVPISFVGPTEGDRAEICLLATAYRSFPATIRRQKGIAIATRSAMGSLHPRAKRFRQVAVLAEKIAHLALDFVTEFREMFLDKVLVAGKADPFIGNSFP